MSTWSLEPVFGWVAIVPLALLMLASLWFTFTTEGVSWLGRAWLSFLRLLAIAILLLGWLRPGLVSNVERDSDAAVAVLIDATQSMTMPSGYGEKTRWSVARETWQTIEQASQSGFGKARFIPFFFDTSLRSVASAAGTGASSEDAADKDHTAAMSVVWNAGPTGKATDLGAALAELQRTQIDPPLRAAFLLTDGTQTVVPPQSDPTLVARQLAQLDQPLVIVGIGPRSENSQLRDLAIEGVPEHLSAFEKNRISVPAVLRARGMQNSEIKISMTLKSSGQADIPLKTVDVLAGQPDQSLPLNLEVEAPKSGEYLLEIKASVDGNELVTSNNTSFSFMTVRSGGSRILYIEGEPRHELTFLNRSLNASLDLQVKYLWIQRITRNRWPIDITKEENLELYDAFILGDVDSKAVTATSLNAIRKRVENGAGLLTLGGYHSYDAGGYASTPLAEVLPIVMTRGASQGFEPNIDERFHIAGPLLLTPTVPHPITRLAAEPENTQLWKELPPLDGANRFGKVKNAPGVQVLATTQDSQPLLVAGEFGRGRVLSFAADSTYRWWMQGQQLRHKQFWRQAMLWLLGRDSLQEGFRLVLDRRRLLRGEEETVGIEWVGGSSNKPIPMEMTLELSRDGKWLRNLESQPSTDNRRQTRLQDLDEPGLYRLALKANGEDGTNYATDVAFLVRDESRELNTPMADWQMMRNIAAASELAGGRLIGPDELQDALQWLRERQSESRVTTLEKRRLGDGVWDSWLYFALFCGVLTLEWACRKRWQLP